MVALFKIVRWLEGWILSASILAIATLIVVNVLCRAVLGTSLAITGELCQFLIVLITFTGLSHAAGAGRHIRMTAFCDMLAMRHRKTLVILMCGATAIMLFVLTWHAIDYVLVVRRLGSASPVLQVPLYLVYACAPVGLFVAGVQYVLAVVKNLRNDGVYLSYDTLDEYHEADAVEG